MRDMRNFRCRPGKKGVALAGYTGPKDVEHIDVPEGVREIGSDFCLNRTVFKDCVALRSITFPASVDRLFSFSLSILSFPGHCPRLEEITLLGSSVKLDPYLFGAGPYPGGRTGSVRIWAPDMPLGKIPAGYKPNALLGFLHALDTEAAVPEERRTEYKEYVRSQRKRLFPLAVRHEALLRFMFAEKMLDHKDIGLLLEECEKQDNAAAKAAVMDYAGRSLKPVDPVKAFRL